MSKKKTLVTQLLFKRYIECNRRTIRCHLWLGLGLAAFGVTVILFGLFSPKRDVDKILPIAAGICVSAFTSFPLKEIRSRKEKIELIQGIDELLLSVEDSARVRELAWKALEKTIAG